MDLKNYIDITDWLAKYGLHGKQTNYFGRSLNYISTLLNDMNTSGRKFGSGVETLDNNKFTFAHVSAALGDIDSLEAWLIRYSEHLSRTHIAYRMDLIPCVPPRIFSPINVRDENGVTPAHISSIFNQLHVVKYLVKNGANVNVRTSDGYTIAHVAALFGCEEIIEFLINSGINVNVESNNGWTLIQVAAVSGHINVVKCLIRLGADIMVLDKNLRNLAHLAGLCQHLELVVWFIENGLDVNAVDDSGRNVYNYLYDI